VEVQSVRVKGGGDSRENGGYVGEYACTKAFKVFTLAFSDLCETWHFEHRGIDVWL
jgi:hypothetical protein